MNPVDKINALFNELDNAVKNKLKCKYPNMTGCDLTVAIHEERKLISKAVLGITPIELFDKVKLLTEEIIEQISALIEFDIKLLEANETYAARKQQLTQMVSEMK